MTYLIRLLSLLALFSLISLNAYAGAVKPSSVPGGIALIQLNSITTRAPLAWFQNKPVMIIQKDKNWYAAVGLPLSLKPGRHYLEAGKDKQQARRIAFEVQDKDYPEQRIRLKDNSKVQLSQKALDRANREAKEIARYKNHWRDAGVIELALEAPVNGPLSSRFGLRRYFNDKPRSPHSGLDFAVPTGTPVLAPANAVVVGTGDFFFSGNAVYLDHGNGLITMYGHLSRIDVQPGDEIKTGQKIGLVGKTGRATGAHLHWSVLLNGTVVDPELFLNK